MCDELYPIWMQQRPDGYCRGCQLIRQLPDTSRDDVDSSANRMRALSAARQQFDELNPSNTGTMSEDEVGEMVKQLRPLRTPQAEIDEATEVVLEQFAIPMGRCGQDKTPGWGSRHGRSPSSSDRRGVG